MHPSDGGSVMRPVDPSKKLKSPRQPPGGRTAQQEIFGNDARSSRSRTNTFLDSAWQMTGKPIFERVFVMTNSAVKDTDLEQQATCLKLSTTNPVRSACLAFVRWKYCDTLVMMAVAANAITLMLQDPLSPPDSALNASLNTAEIVFNTLFTLESVVKMVALGVYQHPMSYLESRWNQLDLFIVFVAWLPQIGSLALSDHGGTEAELNFTSIRSVRVLKLLRGLNHMPSLQQMITTLFGAMRGMLNVLVLFTFIFFALGIMGVQAFRGALRQQCLYDSSHGVPPGSLAVQDELGRTCSMQPDSFGHRCANGTTCSSTFVQDGIEYLNANPNDGVTGFDNIGAAWVIMFQSLSHEGWADIMNKLMAARGQAAGLFFVVTIILTSYFAANLALGVIYEAYKKQHQEKLRNEDVSTRMKRHAKRFFHQNLARGEARFRDQYGDDAPEKARMFWAFEKLARQAALIDSLNYMKTLRQQLCRMEVTNATDLHTMLEDKRITQQEFEKYTKTLEKGVEFVHIDVDEAYAQDRRSSVDLSASRLQKHSSSEMLIGHRTWRQRLEKIVYSSTFGNIIILLIMLNTTVLAVEHHGMSRDLSCLFELANAIFTACFAFEMVLKLVAIGPTRYFYGEDAHMNIFDAIIVLASLVEIGMAAVTGTGHGLSCVAQIGHLNTAETAPGGLSALRMLRITRVFRSIKIVRHWATLSHLMRTLTQSGLGMASCSAILLMFGLIFALFGMEIFGGKLGLLGQWVQNTLPSDRLPSSSMRLPLDEIAPHVSNFNSIGEALLTIFVLVTGEGMDGIMFDLMGVTNPIVGAIFVALVWFVCSFVCLNLFLAILVFNYTRVENDNTSALESINEQQFLSRVLRNDAAVLVYTKRRTKVHEANEEEEQQIDNLHKSVTFIANSLAKQTGDGAGLVIALRVKASPHFVRKMMLKTGEVSETDELLWHLISEETPALHLHKPKPASDNTNVDGDTYGSDFIPCEAQTDEQIAEFLAKQLPKIVRRVQRQRTGGVSTILKVQRFDSNSVHDVQDFLNETDQNRGGSLLKGKQAEWLAELIEIGKVTQNGRKKISQKGRKQRPLEDQFVVEPLEPETHRAGFRMFHDCYQMGQVGENACNFLTELAKGTRKRRTIVGSMAHDAGEFLLVQKVLQKVGHNDNKASTKTFADILREEGVLDSARAIDELATHTPYLTKAKFLEHEMRAHQLLVSPSREHRDHTHNEAIDGRGLRSASAQEAHNPLHTKASRRSVASDQDFEPQRDLLRLQLPSGQHTTVGADQLRHAVVNTAMKKRKEEDDRVAQERYDILDGKVCGMWDSSHPVRLFCTDIIVSPKFKFTINLAILVSTVILAMETPAVRRAYSDSSDDLHGQAVVLHGIDVAVTCIFALEAILKITAMGFACEPHSYLRDGWNRLDAVVLSISLVTLLTDTDASAVKALRAARALRPLRAISRNPGMRVVVEAIFQLLPKMATAMAMVMFFYFIFGTLAIQLFSGKLQYCVLEPAATPTTNAASNVSFIAPHVSVCAARCVRYNFNATQCVGKLNTADLPSDGFGCCDVSGDIPPTPLVIGDVMLRWKNPEGFSFDNILLSVLTLFETATTEGWPTVMASTLDIAPNWKEGAAPVYEGSMYNAVFFVLFIVFGAFCVLNLFVSIVVARFQQIRDTTEGVAYLSPGQQKWIATQHTLLRSTPKRVYFEPDSLRWFRMPFYRFVRGETFHLMTTTLITVNVLFMSFEHYPQPLSWEKFLFFAQYIIMCLFVLEVFVQWIGIGVPQYFSSRWRVFDFTIAISSAVLDTMALYHSRSRYGLIDAEPGAAQSEIEDPSFNPTALRVFRLLRVLRLLKSHKGLSSLVKVLFLALPALANIASLMLLIFIIFAVLGMGLFGEAPVGNVITDDANFATFPGAMLMLFRCTTGEGWNTLMHELLSWQRAEGLGRGHRAATMLYFLLFIVICCYLLLNLTIAIVIDRFSMEDQSSGAMRLEDTALDELRKQWAAVAAKIGPRAIRTSKAKWFGGAETPLYLPSYCIVSLLMNLPPPLGVKNTTWVKELQESGGDFGAEFIPIVRNLLLYENKDGNVFYLDVARALGSRLLSKNDMALGGVGHDVRSILDANLARVADRRVVAAAFTEKSSHSSKAARMQRMSTIAALKQADRLHPVDVTDAFNAASAMQAVFRGHQQRKGKRRARAARLVKRVSQALGLRMQMAEERVHERHQQEASRRSWFSKSSSRASARASQSQSLRAVGNPVADGQSNSSTELMSQLPRQYNLQADRSVGAEGPYTANETTVL